MNPAHDPFYLVNTHTLGRFCTPRIGRADIDVASLPVDILVRLRENSYLTMSSRARQLCYPRSNFLVISSPHQGGHRGSLGQYFYFGFPHKKNPIRLAFALALYTRFLTELSQPLGTVDIKSNEHISIHIFSTVCHPSQTVQLLMSFLRSKQRKF